MALGENVLQARGELGEVGVDQLGEDHPDRVPALGAERGSGAVVDVARLRQPLRTRSRVFSATSGLLFRTRLTVARETPQCLATSIASAGPWDLLRGLDRSKRRTKGLSM